MVNFFSAQEKWNYSAKQMNQIKVNGNFVVRSKINTANTSGFGMWTGNLKRGDYIQSFSEMGQDTPPWAYLHIDRF